MYELWNWCDETVHAGPTMTERKPRLCCIPVSRALGQVVPLVPLKAEDWAGFFSY